MAKKKKKSKKDIRTAVGKQLRYLSRNLCFVDTLMEKFGSELLNNRQIKQLETIKKLYTQQKTMYDNRSHTIEDRIVSISQFIEARYSIFLRLSSLGNTDLVLVTLRYCL